MPPYTFNIQWKHAIHSLWGQAISRGLDEVWSIGEKETVPLVQGRMLFTLYTIEFLRLWQVVCLTDTPPGTYMKWQHSSKNCTSLHRSLSHMGKWNLKLVNMPLTIIAINILASTCSFSHSSLLLRSECSNVRRWLLISLILTKLTIHAECLS